MKFYQWFNSQSILVKALLMLIPGVNWAVEMLIRGSVMLAKKTLLHVVIFALFVLVGWSWILAVIDFLYMLVSGHLILAD